MLFIHSLRQRPPSPLERVGVRLPSLRCLAHSASIGASLLTPSLRSTGGLPANLKLLAKKVFLITFKLSNPHPLSKRIRVIGEVQITNPTPQTLISSFLLKFMSF
jgi:hypothetical protein